MVANTKCTRQPEVNIPFSVSPEGDSSDPGSEETTPSHNEGSGRNYQNVGRRRSNLGKKRITVTVIIVLFLSLVCLAGYSIHLYVQVNQLKAQVKQLKAASTPKPFLTTSCFQGWIPNADLCFFFSDTESTWDLSHSNCSSYGASLLVIATPQQMAFINENKAPAEYWLGLQREDKRGTWKQPDGSDVWFEIKGEGLCASLNDGVVSSTDCDSHRRWICRKLLHAV